MTNLITVGDTINANEMISSLEIVKQINFFRQEEGNRTELQHKSILDIIRDEFSDEISRQEILPTYYTDSFNRQQPHFVLTLNQAKQILVRESKFVRKAIIAYIDDLEKQQQFQIPQTLSQALMLAAKQAEVIEQQQLQLTEQAPKVLFAEAVTTSNRCVLVAELAKIITQNGVEIGQNRLFEWMRSNNYLCSKGEYYNQPTQRAIEMGLFEIKKTAITHSDGHVTVSVTTKVTGKGQIYFINKFIS